MRLDALSSISIFKDTQRRNEKATATKHNGKSILAEKTVPDAVSDGDMVALHKDFSVKKSDAKRSAKLDKEELKAKRQRNKSRGADKRKAQVANVRSKKNIDPIAIDKLIASQH